MEQLDHSVGSLKLDDEDEVEDAAQEEKEQETEIQYVELITFGYKFGAPKNTVHNFNLRKLPNPKRTMRKTLTGMNKELQEDLFSIKKVQEVYAELKEEVLKLIEQHLLQLMKNNKEDKDKDIGVNNKHEENHKDEKKQDNEEVEMEKKHKDHTSEEKQTRSKDKAEDKGEEEEKEEEGDEDNEEEEKEEEGEDEDNEEEEEDDENLIRIGIGCNSGKHRSVAVVEVLAKEINLNNKKNKDTNNFRVLIVHRDVYKEKIKDGKRKSKNNSKNNKDNRTWQRDNKRHF